MTQLLSRQQLNQVKAAVQKQEIDRGIKIGKIVNDLRTTRIKEELDLEKFKTATTGEVQKEIDELFSKRDTLRHDVAVLEKKIELLHKPFEEKWERLRNQRIQELDTERSQLEEKRIEIERITHTLTSKAQEAAAKEKSTEEEYQKARDLTLKAEARKKSADKEWQNVLINSASVQSKIDAETNTLNKKREELLEKEKSISEREDAIRQSSKELLQREIFINDKYNTLIKSARALGIKI